MRLSSTSVSRRSWRRRRMARAQLREGLPLRAKIDVLGYLGRKP
jgi:hypothetical protein